MIILAAKKFKWAVPFERKYQSHWLVLLCLFVKQKGKQQILMKAPLNLIISRLDDVMLVCLPVQVLMSVFNMNPVSHPHRKDPMVFSHDWAQPPLLKAHSLRSVPWKAVILFNDN